jgi:hypothetical protein
MYAMQGTDRESFASSSLRKAGAGWKTIRELPGMSTRMAEVLESRGFSHIHHLLGKFLVLSQHISSFQVWLEEMMGETRIPGLPRVVEEVSASISEWAANNM